MRIDEYTNLYLHQLYEGGGYELSIILQRLELRKDYTREKARIIISQFLNKYTTSEDGKHPLMFLHTVKTRNLLDLLEQDSNNKSVEIYPDAPSVW